MWTTIKKTNYWEKKFFSCSFCPYRFRKCVSYVEWRETNLMSLALLFHYLMLNMFRMLIHTDTTSWVVLVWFDVCWCYVVVWLGWSSLVWCPYAGFGLHTDTTPPQPNHNVTPTHIEPEEYNPWNNSTNRSQASEDGCINIRNMLSIK